MPDTAAQRVVRRLVTIPTVLLGFAVLTPLLPAVLALTLVVDLAAGQKRLPVTRLTVFLFCVLAVETLGLTLLAFTWLTTQRTPARAARTFAVQRLYTSWHLAALTRLFSLRFVLEGDVDVGGGPLLVFVRHASLVDALVPALFLANARRMELRYVLKRELLRQPCLDVAGHWTPNHFVDRGGTDTTAELHSLERLKVGLGPGQGVVLYPEGTRFSPRKREQLLGKLAGPSRDRAEALKQLLPIRRGGPMTLLDAKPRCDVVFIGHHGMDGFNRFGELLRGALIGKTVTVRFWRAPAASIPDEVDARWAWLNTQWQLMDDWLTGFES